MMEFSERFAARARRANLQPVTVLEGKLIAYRPDKHMVTVQIAHADDDPQETGWIPFHTPFAGAGYGDQEAPEPGSAVYVVNIGNDALDTDEYFAIGMRYTNNQQPPFTNMQPGERRILSKFGGGLRLDADGATTGDGNGSANLVVGDNGVAGVGDVSTDIPSTQQAVHALHVNADVIDQFNAKSLQDLIKNYEAHVNALTASIVGFNASAYVASMAAQLIAGYLENVPHVSGSQFVRIR